MRGSLYPQEKPGTEYLRLISLFGTITSSSILTGGYGIDAPTIDSD